MILHGVRLLFLLVVIALTASYAFQDNVTVKGGTYVTLYIVLPALAAVGLILLDMLWRRKRLSVLSGVFFGLLAGVVIAYTLTLVVDLVVEVFPLVADPPRPPGLLRRLQHAHPRQLRRRRFARLYAQLLQPPGKTR